jgi:hypothetical protein
MCHNHLLLNPEKTGLFLFHRRRAKLPSTLPSVSIGNRKIEFNSSSSLRWLGVEFDPLLEMDIQVSHTCRSCYLLLRMLRQIRPTLSRSASLLLTNALICSRIDYCNSLLYATNNGTVSKLQRVLNLAVRVITNSRRSDHITPLLKDLGWLRVRERIIQKISILCFKSMQLQSPQYLSSAITVYKPSRSLRSVNSASLNLVLGSAKTMIGRGKWNVIAPQVWNALPENVREHGIKYAAFHTRLSSFLLSDNS